MVLQNLPASNHHQEIKMHSTLFAALLASAIAIASATKGVVTLDDLTFDKVRARKITQPHSAIGTLDSSHAEPLPCSCEPRTAPRARRRQIVDGSKPILVKFDKQYAYGDAEDSFKETAEKIGAQSLTPPLHLRGHDRTNPGVQVSSRPISWWPRCAHRSQQSLRSHVPPPPGLDSGGVSMLPLEQLPSRCTA